MEEEEEEEEEEEPRIVSEAVSEAVVESLPQPLSRRPLFRRDDNATSTTANDASDAITAQYGGRGGGGSTDTLPPSSATLLEGVVVWRHSNTAAALGVRGWRPSASQWEQAMSASSPRGERRNRRPRSLGLSGIPKHLQTAAADPSFARGCASKEQPGAPRPMKKGRCGESLRPESRSPELSLCFFCTWPSSLLCPPSLYYRFQQTINNHARNDAAFAHGPGELRVWRTARPWGLLFDERRGGRRG